MDMATVDTFLRTTVADLAVKVAAAIAFWIVGRWLIGRVIAPDAGDDAPQPGRPDADASYLGSIVAVALNIALVLGILGYFGIQTTSFAAMLAGAGVAIGAAWSGMLGNFAAGAFMLVLRPFKVGDFVSIGGVTGTVHELGLFGTTIVTPDNVLTLVGNGKIFGDTIQNFSVAADASRRAHGAAGRRRGSHRRDRALQGGGRADSQRARDNPRPKSTCSTSTCVGTVIAVRPYCHTDHYWQVYFDTNEAIDARRQGSRLARADTREPHADDPGAGVGRLAREAARSSTACRLRS